MCAMIVTETVVRSILGTSDGNGNEVQIDSNRPGKMQGRKQNRDTYTFTQRDRETNCPHRDSSDSWHKQSPAS